MTIPDKDENCYENDCPYKKPHKHIRTIHGNYIKYIIEKPTYKEIDHADTWR